MTEAAAISSLPFALNWQAHTTNGAASPDPFARL